MTHEQWIKLTPDEQRIKVAELCGWKLVSEAGWTDQSRWRNGPRSGWGDIPVCLGNLPDYLNDLNDMHEAETHLYRDFNKQRIYMEFLDSILQTSGDESEQGKESLGFAEIHATAKERAEAFVLTMESK